jgi:phosphate-selective porin OprO/OprP
MYQYGSLFIQSEWVGNYTTNAAAATTGPTGAVTRGADQGTLFYQSFYIQGLYFLTGEHRVYDYQKGLVGRVIPNENAFAYRTASGPIFGRGAWQVKNRLNWIDLNDKQIRGGRLLGYTTGFNWFLNPNAKFQFDFDAMHRYAGGGQGAAPSAAFNTYGMIYGFGTRFAADF